MIELLVTEGRLPRATATQIEETLLKMTMADGHWRIVRQHAETPHPIEQEMTLG